MPTVNSRQSRDAGGDRRFRVLLENARDAVALLDGEGRFVYCNPAAFDIVGIPAADLIGRSMFDLLEPGDRPRIQKEYAEILASPGGRFSTDARVVHADGSIRIVETHAVNQLADPEMAGILLCCRDVTDRRTVEEALRESEQRYAIVMAGSNDGFWDWRIERDSVYYSRRWKEMLGLAESCLSDSPSEWLDRCHPEDIQRLRHELDAHIKGNTPHFESEHRLKHLDGSYRWFLARGLCVRDESGTAVRIAGSLTDITDRKAAEARLIHDALHDPLTGLPNRALFLDRLNRFFARHRRHPEHLFAVLFLDLDRFKLINDSLGHAAGDDLLVSIARRLERAIRIGDTVSRLGGDEFAILLEDLREPEEASMVAERIQRIVNQPVVLRGQELIMTTSIGIAINTHAYRNTEDMLRDADQAMYHAKARGRARAVVFSEDMEHQPLGQLQLETDLRHAQERNQFHLLYHPLVSLHTGLVTGCEVLLRWHHPQFGVLSPGEFMALAEQTGLIVPIGDWVLRTAATLCSRWQRAGLPGARICVNLSRTQFRRSDLGAGILSVLAETGLEPSRLQIELTEAGIMERADEAVAVVSALRQKGIRFSIDDFGTGYSSLGYLKRFPVDTLKIDRSFISEVTTDADSAAIASAVIALAHSLGMKVVAEGVESEAQLAFLHERNCDEAQGHLFSLPLPAEEMEAMLGKKLMP